MWPAMIDGKRVQLANSFEDRDPSTGAVFAMVARGDTDAVDAAVSAAARALPRWSKTAPVERSRRLRALSESIQREAGKLAALESQDTGKPIRQARTDVSVAARYFEYYANIAETLYGATIPISEDLFSFTLREPHGVTAHIIPWNYPLQIGARTIAPALAAGNCCVLKPAEQAPLTAIRLGELAEVAGFPNGVLNVVPGMGEEVGAALAAHPGIDHLSFTGSFEVGRLVSRSAARSLIPVMLELGGKSPNVVFADANLDSALPVITNSLIQNAGQTCVAGSRLLVAADVHDAVVEDLAGRFGRLRIGPGLSDPDLGPLISSTQLEGVTTLVDAGKREAKLVCGGGPPDAADLDGGYFFAPTLFDNVDPSSTIAQKEVFGPVLAVIPFRDEAEAIAAANNTEYGLLAAVWTTNIGRALRMAKEVRAGQIFVNGFGAGGGVELPFGGFKHSGHGREKGVEALFAYTQTKTVTVNIPASLSADTHFDEEA